MEPFIANRLHFAYRSNLNELDDYRGVCYEFDMKFSKLANGFCHKFQIIMSSSFRRLHHDLAFLLAPLLFVSCGLGESEPDRAIIQMQNKAGCSIEFDIDGLVDYLRNESSAHVNAASDLRTSLDCIQSQFRDALRQVRGKNPGEISVSEAIQLIEDRVLTMEKPSDSQLRFLTIALSFLHSDHRPALTQETLDHWCDFLMLMVTRVKKNQSFIFSFPNTNDHLFPVTAHDVVEIWREFSKLFPRNAYLTKEEISTLMREFRIEEAIDRDALLQSALAFVPLDANENLSISWLFDLVEESVPSPEVDLERLFRYLKWSFRRLGPGETWTTADTVRLQDGHLLILEVYERVIEFLNTKAAMPLITEAKVRAIVSAMSEDANEVSKLFQVLRRVIHYNGASSRFSISLPGFISFFMSPSALASIFQIEEELLSSVQLVDSEINTNKNKIFRVLLFDDAFRSHRVGGYFESIISVVHGPGYQNSMMNPRLIDERGILENDLLFGLLERHIISVVSHAFVDEFGRVQIEQDSALLLTLLNYLNQFSFVEIRAPDGRVLERYSTPIRIPQENLGHIIRIAADFLVGSSNQNGRIEVDELIEIFGSFYSIMNNRSMGLDQDEEVTYRALRPGADPSSSSIDLFDAHNFFDSTRYYCRQPLIRGLHQVLTSTSFESQTRYYGRPFRPSVFPAILSAMPQDQQISLLHALFPSTLEPRTFYRLDWEKHQYIPEIVGQVARTEDSQMLLVVGELITRGVSKCDSNHDASLDWEELDCLITPVAGLLRNLIDSDMFDLDPGMHDGLRKGLELLESQPLLRPIGKALFINGGVRQFYLQRAEVERAVSALKLSEFDLARLISLRFDERDSSVLEPWMIEVNARFGVCDSNQDELWDVNEMSCVVRDFIGRISGVPQEWKDRALSQPYLAWSLVVGLRFREVTQLLLQSDASKILRLMEEGIRRSRKFDELPEC